MDGPIGKKKEKTIRNGRTGSMVRSIEIDEGEGKPSRWNTLRAMRVLRWDEASRA
jgi:hypothetical protein